MKSKAFIRRFMPMVLSILAVIAIPLFSYLDSSRVAGNNNENENEELLANSPLFQRQLNDKLDQFRAGAGKAGETNRSNSSEKSEMALIFISEGISVCIASGCGTSACIGSACSGSACGGSACGGSACGGSACGGSACAGSACGVSLCAGSACGVSLCGGSVCNQSLCAGSYCAKCGAHHPSEHSRYEYAYSHSSSDENKVAVSPGRIVGLNVAPANKGTGTLISWIVTGAEVESYRLYKENEETSSTPTFVSQGLARADQQMRILYANGSANEKYLLEVTDAAGRLIRYSMNAKEGQQLNQVAHLNHACPHCGNGNTMHTTPL